MSEAPSKADLDSVPKAELHLHLRGAIPRQYLCRQFRKYPPRRALASVPAAQLEWLLGHPGIRRLVESEAPERDLPGLFRYAAFDHFLAAYLFTSYFVRAPDDFAGLVDSVLQALRARNIVYAECTVSLPEYLAQGLELAELLAILQDRAAGAPCVRWIVDPVRNLGPEAAERLLERLAAGRPPSVIGLTLGGAERLHPPAPFRRVYDLARASGMRTTVHAGETLGPESVWDALRVLQVERIGHGVRAIEDPALVRHLAERGVPLEVCPTSNVCTGVYPSLQAHPIRRLFDAGVPLTVNTDDPTFFDVSLTDELASLRGLGFSGNEIEALVGNAFRFAFDAAAAAEAAATERR